MKAKHRKTLRTALSTLHRWVGLILGVVLVLAGLSGSLLAFDHELDGWLNSAMLRNRAGVCAAPLPPSAAAQAVQQAWPGAAVNAITLPESAADSYRVQFKHASTADNEAGVDACSGQLLASRNRDAVSLDSAHVMPLLLRWHMTLLQGKTGREVLGWLAVAWVVLLLAGVYLAWPRPGHWRRSVSVTRGVGAFRTSYELHRAAGLISAVFLLVVAGTGFFMGLPQLGRQLVSSVMSVPVDARTAKLAPLAPGETEVGWDGAAVKARAGSPATATLVMLRRDAANGVYQARMRRADDWQPVGTLRLFIDMRSGAQVSAADPLSGTTGQRLLAVMFPLHSGSLFGLPSRILTAVLGLLPLLFFVTGLVIWISRRRLKHRGRLAAAQAPGPTARRA
ncbi:PepSY domain-containing protein [Achromobacter sp. DH1f]|uniref:PepSY-associated TM helix domain-containing protein n=1 Tax=Achromobacter sp. DH1f TaxID=1397275 RepID=UPI000469F65B|nr:PepSY-associated TM helix domain-containing protein [Achromobacter sp. DH1f]